MDKTQQGCRRSARLREKENQHDRVQKPPGRKRKRAAEPADADKNIDPELLQEQLQTVKGASVYHWIQNHKWPGTLFKSTSMQRMKDLRLTDSAIPTSTLQSNTKTPVARSYTYKSDKCVRFLNYRGSFLSDHEDGITHDDMAFCQKLFERDCEVPPGTIFDANTFGYIVNRMRSKNETAVMKIMHQLIIPSAEIEIYRGHIEFKHLIDSINESWDGSISLDETTPRPQLETHIQQGQYQLPRPQPDYAVGFSKDAFNRLRLTKLRPFLGGQDDTSSFKGTVDMFFPFFTAEAKCSKGSLEEADRQNAHSMARSLKGVVELFQLVKREKELHRRILAFSISHDHSSLKIYAHYPIITSEKITYYQHLVHGFSFIPLNGKEKWTSYKFVMALYNDWVPTHFERLCSAVDALPDDINFGVAAQPEIQSEQSAPQNAAGTDGSFSK